MVAQQQILAQQVLEALAEKASAIYHSRRRNRLEVDMRAIQRQVLKEAGFSDPPREMFQAIGKILGERAAKRSAAQRRNGWPPVKPQAIRIDRKEKSVPRFRETLWP